MDVKSRDEFSTDITTSRGAEVSNANWSESRWVVNLSGGRCTKEQRRQLKAFNRIVQGRRKKFWYRRYDDDEWELSGADGSGEIIGVGDGARTVFQAGISDTVQGVTVFKPVWALDHDIAPLGKTVYNLPATPTREVQIFLDGISQGGGYAVAREGGQITFSAPVAAGVQVKIKGGFFALMRLDQEYIETEPASAGWWKVSDGVMLIEPKGQR